LVFSMVAPAALPPIAPAMSWIIKLIMVADIIFPPVISAAVMLMPPAARLPSVSPRSKRDCQSVHRPQQRRLDNKSGTRERVAQIVRENSDDMSLPKADRRRVRIARMPLKSKEARLVKMADVISNLRAIAVSPPAGWPAERKLGYLEGCRQLRK
jgi:uncharacterized protein (UPF0147 family)